ncbi:alpha/beta hydrolase [Streptomyces silvisoli]|uniref:Alpha/beta hydrolase n=1 Tax=Streptomyces silvisoli TaxID=3034235 RepID=A0ABT5ZT89_9ACTN|nr:alpha/beta hydrolase [Streptomyces silvisoli]MDF3292238.1 alpha/beta hydrolase [Streptomyces silvisoli]
MRAIAVILILFGCLATTSAGDSASAASRRPPVAAGTSCRSVRFPAHLAGTASVQVSGLLCLPADGLGEHPLQILLAGATYDKQYWLLPSAPGRPSWVSWMAARGQSTLTLDRPGTGDSGRPPADLLTMASEADVVHQIVGQLRSGVRHGRRFGRIVLVGHSVGTSVALVEAATYHDVDGVVASGFLHSYGPKLGTLFSDMHPAAQDPRFTGETEPDGYLTTLPNTRATYFYDSRDSSPVIVDLDELTKSTMTTGEERTIPAAADPKISQAITVPVLVGVGENDQLFCGGPLSFPCTDASAIIAHEQPFYSPAANIEAYVLPGAGHVMNLQDNSTRWFAAATDWLNRRFPA